MIKTKFSSLKDVNSNSNKELNNTHCFTKRFGKFASEIKNCESKNTKAK
jgi:hypothetical protein